MTITRQQLISLMEAAIEEGDACQLEDMLDRLQSGEPFESENNSEDE